MEPAHFVRSGGSERRIPGIWSAAFVVAVGFAFGWLGAGVAAFSVAVFCLVLNWVSVPPWGEVCTIDDEGVKRVVTEGRDGREKIAEAVRWDELLEIRILTTDEGPLVEDVFWVFTGRDGKGCLLPGTAIGDAMFARLKCLEGVDHREVVRACGSTSNGSFLVWSGVPGSATLAGHA